MKLKEQNYRSRHSRPTPHIHKSEGGDLLIIATSWGENSALKKTIEIVSEYVQASKNDVEVTNPFDILTCMSPLANSIRTSLFLANEAIYRNENKSEYRAGVEVVVIARKGSEVSIGQIGNPAIYLSRENSSLVPLCTPNDNFTASPLPVDLLGVDSTTNPKFSSFHYKEKDKMILLSRSNTTADILQLIQKGESFENSIKNLVMNDSESPFWMGLLEF